MRLSVVIPAYNEADRLPSTLNEIVGYLGRHTRWLPAEVIVVDDGSSDATSDVVISSTAADGVTLVCHRLGENRGKGAAVRSGFAAARGDQILLSDADMATPIAEIERLADAAPSGAAIGSRALDRGRIETRQPLYRDLMGRVFNLAVRIFAVRGIADTQCGFKLFNGDLGRSLAAVQRLDGFAFDVELLVWVRSWDVPLQEVSVRWRHVEASRVQAVTHSADMFRDLLRISWWRISGQFDAPPGAAAP